MIVSLYFDQTLSASSYVGASVFIIEIFYIEFLCIIFRHFNSLLYEQCTIFRFKFWMSTYVGVFLLFQMCASPHFNFMNCKILHL